MGHETRIDNSDANTEVRVRTSKKVSLIMSKHCINLEEPDRCEPDPVGASQWNRARQRPVIPYVHQDLHTNLDRYGFDPKRLHVGYGIQFKSPELIEHHIMHQEVLDGCSGV